MTNEVYYDENRNEIPMPLDERKVHQQKSIVTDAYGNELVAGDTIFSIKPLPVKKWVDIKQWEKFSTIRLTDDPTLVLARHPKNGDMYLKTEFFKKG